MKRGNVLVVDDEPRYVQLLRLNLHGSGYRVAVAFDGSEALRQVLGDPPDLVILDVMLPDIDGYSVCRQIREVSTVPIIMLTAKADESHKVRGLEVGADDYITKPFAVEELLARVRAVLRRRCWDAQVEPPAALSRGGLVLDPQRHRVTARERESDLTPTEFRLLHLLVANAGRVLVPREVLRRVWGPEYEDQTEILRTTIRRLRQKIEADSGHPAYILTVRGVGYSFAGK